MVTDVELVAPGIRQTGVNEQGSTNLVGIEQSGVKTQLEDMDLEDSWWPGHC